MNFGLNIVLGIELILIDNNQYSCRTCLLEKKNQYIDIVSAEIIEGNLTVILEALPKKYPIALTLSGKGILHKHIDILNENMIDDQLFQAVYPTVDKQEFYCQQYVADEICFISIIRKQIADDVLGKLSNSGLKIYKLSLGGLMTCHILPQLNLYDNEIGIDLHHFVLKDSKNLKSYAYGKIADNKFEIQIEKQVLDEKQIVAYATSFQLLLNDKVVLIQAEVEKINQLFANFIGNESFKKIGVYFLIILFSLLFISFLIFSYFDSKNLQLSSQVGLEEANSNQVDSIKTNIKKNQTLLENLNWNTGYNYGFLLNEIGSSTPRQVKLLEIIMNNSEPVLEQQKHTQIKINGITNNLTQINNWMYDFKQKSWVKSIKLLKYEESQSSNQYLFSLLITY